MTTAQASTIMADHRYASDVFLTPPWPEIYETDNERQHDLVQAVQEYDHLCVFFQQFGYRIHVLPKNSVADRVHFIERVLKLV